jgi:nucleoside-diphosphate-sugar epimerase
VKAAVTGATGFVGSHLVDALRARGAEVSCLVRSLDKAKAAGLGEGSRLVAGSLHDASALRSLAAGADVLFHVAGALTATAGDNGQFARVNREGTERLVEAARAEQVPRLVYVSSLAASGPSRRGAPLSDAGAGQPVTAYGRSKLAGEEVVRASGIPFTIVRPPSVYGPRDRNQFLPAFRLARSGWAPVLGDGLQELSLIHVRDLADALLAVADRREAEGKTYHAAHPEVVTQRQLFAAVGRAVGRKVRVVALPRPVVWAVLYGVGAVADFVGSATVLRPTKAAEFFAPAWTCSSEALVKDVGWKARLPLEEGLAETAHWYREAGWL